MREPKKYAISEVINTIFEDNFSHFEFIYEMNGGDCDCDLHTTIKTLRLYQGE